MNFTEFESCHLSTDDIINNIKMFAENEQRDILRFIYALLFCTDVKIENKIDLQKIISAYLNYKQGKFAITE